MVNEKMIRQSFGLESADLTARRGVQEPISAVSVGVSGWALESEKSIATLIRSSIAPLNDGGTMDPEQRRKASANIVSNGIQKLVEKFGNESATYNSLPKDIKAVTEVPAREYFTLKEKFAGASGAEKFKYGYMKDQAKAALESALWSIFSGIHQMQGHKFGINGAALEGADLYKKLGNIYAPSNVQYGRAGLESTSIATFTDQIYIPKISAFNSWINVASVIMPKVQKTKTVLNEICEIPVSTKVMVMYELDEEGAIKNEYRREDLYSKMDMSLTSPTLDAMRTKDLVISDAEFGQYIDLHTTPLSKHGNKSFLARNEHIGPQLEIVKLTIANDAGDGTTDIIKTIGDTRAGVSEGPALGQLDTKGKVIPVVLDPAKPDEQYFLSFDWDVQNQKIFLLVNKSKAEMKDLKGLTLKANMRDLEQTLKSRIAFKILEERTVLKTPEIDRYVLPIMPDEMDNLAERGSVNHLNKLVELTAEFTQHKKESRWIKEFRQMEAVLKEAKIGPNGVINHQVLYAEQHIALNTAHEYRKDESLAYYLGNNLSVLKDKLGKDANSQYGVQMSMFTGTLSLNVISQCLQHITGDISEDSDAKFLGVAQSDRVRAISIGQDKSAPVQSIVVGTDKTDFDAKGWDTTAGKQIADEDVVYEFNIIPTYADENIHTTLFLEQPTKVISGAEIRANEYPALPSMIIHEGYKFNKIRGAVANLTIKGAGFRAISN